MTRFKDLPHGWCSATLGDVGTWTSGGTPSRGRTDYYGGEIPWVKTGDLPDGPILEIPESLTEEGLINSAARLLPSGTLLIAMYGATIGKLGILKVLAATNQACAALLPDGTTRQLIPYLFYYLLSERAVLRLVGQGGAQPNISQTIIKAHPVVLAPLPEQYRIVAAIDSYFSRLDEAIMLLERIQRNLTRYRATVLNAAVTGRLVPTEAELARREGRDYQPASVLLERILAERRRRWEEAELAKMKAAGKPPTDDRWKAKYKEPAAPDTSGLPELPEGWLWATVAQVASPEDGALAIGPFGSNLKVSDYTDSGVPLVFVRNIRSESFDGAGAKYISPEKALELQAHTVDGGDLLITKMGDPPGDATIYPRTAPRAVITADCIKLRPHPLLRCPEFLLWAIRSAVVQAAIRGITKGVAQEKVSLARFRSVGIPLAPLAEQERIADEMSRLYSDSSQVDRAVVGTLRRIARLRQAILKWAFDGRLVDQDPTDEPASALLERIKAERASTKETAGRARRPARRRATA